MARSPRPARSGMAYRCSPWTTWSPAPALVSLHLPLTPRTAHLIDADRLARMRPGAVLVNTSRGGVAATDALVGALRSGHLAGAGLDVFEAEPLMAGHPLTTLDTVVLTSHAA